MTVTLTLSPEC